MANKKDPRIKEYFLKDGSKRYMFRVYAGVNELTGKKEKITRKGYKTYLEASRVLKRIEYEIATHTLPKKEVKKRFKQVYDVWFDNYKLTVKESTWATTELLFRVHILPVFGDLLIDKIDVLFCQKVVNNWSIEQPKNFKKLKNYAKNVLDYAVTLDYIQSNPMLKITIPKGEQVKSAYKNIVFLSKDELIEFLAISKEHSSEMIYLFFHLLAFTGLRKGEALALNWNDVDFKASTLVINKTVSRGFENRLIINTPKTQKGNRSISLDATTLSILKKWRLDQKQELFQRGIKPSEEQLIFSDIYNETVNPSITKTWLKPLFQYFPKVISAHGFRHTHASLLFESGASIKEVQERLGHADIQTTMNIYTHVTEAKKEETANKFANFMAKEGT